MPGECRGNFPRSRKLYFPQYFPRFPRYFPPFPPRPGHHAGNREQKTGTLYPVSNCGHIPRVPFPTFPTFPCREPTLTPWSSRSGRSISPGRDDGATQENNRTPNELAAPDTLESFELDSPPRCKVRAISPHHSHRPFSPPHQPPHHRPHS